MIGNGVIADHSDENSYFKLKLLIRHAQAGESRIRHGQGIIFLLLKESTS